MKVLAFLTDGFETVEALAVIDILRRANIGVDTVSITGNKSVKSAQNIIVEADKLIEDWADENNYEIEGSWWQNCRNMCRTKRTWKVRLP